MHGSWYRIDVFFQFASNLVANNVTSKLQFSITNGPRSIDNIIVKLHNCSCTSIMANEFFSAATNILCSIVPPSTVLVVRFTCIGIEFN